MFKDYPKNSNVIFIPFTVQVAQEDGPNGKQFRAVGQAYMPGKPVVNARAMLPREVCQTMEDAEEYIDQAKMVGEVMYIVQDVKHTTWLHLRGLKSNLMEITWHGIEIPFAEFQYICAHYTCSKCGGKLDQYQARSTSIMYKEVNKLGRVVCHHCVNKAKAKMLPAFQEALDGINAV